MKRDGSNKSTRRKGKNVRLNTTMKKEDTTLQIYQEEEKHPRKVRKGKGRTKNCIVR